LIYEISGSPNKQYQSKEKNYFENNQILELKSKETEKFIITFNSRFELAKEKDYPV
jgi:hypothetical protein